MAAAALAIVLDQVIKLIETAVSRRSRPRMIVAIIALSLIIGGGIMPKLIEAAGETDQPRIIVGAKTFTEQFILSTLMVNRLNEAGFAAESISSLGSIVLFDALTRDLVDCYIDYSGTIWANSMKRNDNKPADTVLSEMTDWLKNEHNVVCLGSIGFENTYALAVTRETAERLQLGTIDDLRVHAPNLTIGSDYEFFARPEWISLEENYSLSFAGEISFDHALMYAAVDKGQVDVISAYSTDGWIADYDLVVLEDTRRALPPYEAALLISPRSAGDNKLIRAVSPLVGAIDADLMRWANMLVDVDGLSIEQAAQRLQDTLDYSGN
jgi:osmoprotectant transport system permease protein